MRFPRRLCSRLTAIAGITALVLMGVYFGRAFKIDIGSEDGFKVRRDGTTITFNMPWPPIREKLEGEKAVSVILDSLLGSITNVAGEILDAGSSVADGVAQEGSGLSSSVLDGINKAVSDATGIIENILGDASSLVGNILATATGVSNIGILSSGSSTLRTSGATSSEPQEFLPQTSTCSVCNSSLSTSNSASNITAAPTFLPSTSNSSTVYNACPPTSTFTKSDCVAQLTETYTVTEMWHSTHYAETATFYSFIANLTVTCTETISVCSSTPYLSPIFPTNPPNTTDISLIACADGVLAKREEDCPSTSAIKPSAYSPSHPCPNTGYSCSECPDGWFCPPQQTPAASCPCGYGWACAHCAQGWYCIPGPTGALNSVASLLLNSSSTSIVCPNGKLAKSQQNCSTIQPSTMLSFTANLPSLSSTINTNSATLIPSITCNDGAVAARTQECLDGILGPTSLLVFRTSPVRLDGKILSSVAAGVASALLDVDSLSGNFLSTVVAEITAAIGVGAVQVTTLSTVAAAIKAETTMVQSQIQTAVNSVPTTLPVVATVINGVSTAIPVVDIVVNRVPTPLPVINNPAGILELLSGLRGRQRLGKSTETVATTGVCEENPDHKSCG